MTSPYPTFSAASAKPSFAPPASSQSNYVMILPVDDADRTLDGLLRGLSELHSMADSIAHELPASLTPEIEAAIAQAVAGGTLPADWARRLAEDVANLAD